MSRRKNKGQAAADTGPAKATRGSIAGWPRRNPMAALVTTVVVLGLGIVVWQAVAPPAPESAVVVPALSQVAARGKVLFDANCAQCHGQNAMGTTKGPPFIHDIYNPGHHGDGAFLRAVRSGVQQHHWRFGNMMPQPQVSNAQVRAIIRYVREMQAANGIKYRPHRM